MRQIIIDTETTGLDPQDHRIIEFAALELVDRRVTGRTVHFRVNPERDIDFAATEVHGMTWEDLKSQPKFCDVAAEFLDFARGAEWIIHNAPFDVGFLDAELKRAGIPSCSELYAGLIDTLALARDLYPGKRNGLDALCERFGIDNSHRSIHGALLDAQLLAEAYLAMTRGQESLTIDMAAPTLSSLLHEAHERDGAGAVRLPVAVIEPTAEELDAHRDYLAALFAETKGRCLWLLLEPVADAMAA
ncbi:MAG TPA: DNA polymerase III subunit epsilon [Casimicrobiaceae bacterium]|nr:DNA polymerase III subunit epsilon [Casimicrobiaceae bacterium]